MLFQVILTLHPSRCFSNCLDSREHKGEQHADNHDNDEQFDEGEADVFTIGKVVLILCTV
jgi:hypothetical protein